MYEVLLAALSERLQEEQALLGTRISPASMLAAWHEGRAYGEIAEGAFVSFCARWPTADPGWEEVGTCWTAPSMRGKGFGTRAFVGVCRGAPSGTRLFLITHREEMVRIVSRHGWCEAAASAWMAQVPWSASCGVCDRLPDAEKASCSYRALPAKCRMFVSA